MERKMSDEATKIKEKFGELEKIIFKGTGIDIGCGDDPIFEDVRPFDMADGDANKITKYVHEKFDFVFSSHALEHMINPFDAIVEWWKLVKENGYMYIVVPDEDLYEQGVFPSRWNADHKHTFTIFKHSSWSKNSVNIIDLIKYLPDAKLVKLELQDDRYDYTLKDIDQTYIGNNMTAMAQIAFAIQKQEKKHFSISAHIAAKKYALKLYLQKNHFPEKLSSMNAYLKKIYSFALNKFYSEKYSGIMGKIHFFIRVITYIGTNLSKKILRIKNYNFSFGIEKLIIFLVIKLSKFFSQTKKMDWLIVQPNGLGDAIINKTYTDMLIQKYKIEKNKIIIISLDQWKDFKELLHPDIYIYFINLKKFERSLIYRLKVVLFLKKYYFSRITCNLKWKTRCITDLISCYADGDKKFFSLYQERFHTLNQEFSEWCGKKGITLIPTNNIENELNRINFFYTNVFGESLSPYPLRTEIYSLKKSNLQLPNKYIVFHIGMSEKRRRWPINKFIETANYLSTKGFSIVFCGGKFERDLEDKVKNLFTTYIDTLTAQEYTELLGNADAVLCGDTGPAHLSLALNTPTAIMLGGGHYGNYFPYPEKVHPLLKNVAYITNKKNCFKCDWECSISKGKFLPCTEDIEVKEVIHALNTLLRNQI